MRAFSFLVAMFAGLISIGPPATSPSATTSGGTVTASGGRYTATVVSGTITDAASGAPLVGAQIHVEGLTLSTLANNSEHLGQ